jgi:hypothetical protein
VVVQILVQLSGSTVCINEMLSSKLIPILATEVTSNDSVGIWTDVARLLLAVVVYRTDLSKDDVAGTMNILKRMCVSGLGASGLASTPGNVREAASDELIKQCACILAFLSLQVSGDGLFMDMDVIMRAILTSPIANIEMLFEPCATVIYNITCHESAMLLLLKDGLYLNIMIKMMRSAKIQTQEIVTEAIRTMCSSNRCIELLLTMDLLSDLIVIALLRTSSDNIKEVCSEAFLNMLCCPETRMKLLKGDLWWAVMRLARSNNKSILWTCQRILYDLSTTLPAPSSTAGIYIAEDDVIVPLRDNHVLTFIKDIASSKSSMSAGRATSRKASQVKLDEVDIAFIEQCLRCMNNFVYRFNIMHSTNRTAISQSSTASTSPTKSKAVAGGAPVVVASVLPGSLTYCAFVHHEVNAVVSTCTDVLQLSKDMSSVRTALLLLLKLTQDVLRDTVVELISYDIEQVIIGSHPVWSASPHCCVLVTRLLWELTKSSEFTKSVDVMSIVDILCVAYSLGQSERGGSFTGSEIEPVSMAEIISNVAGIILNFINNSNTASLTTSFNGNNSARGGTNTAAGNNDNKKVVKCFLSSPLWGLLVCDCFGISREEAPQMTVSETALELEGLESHRRSIVSAVLTGTANASHVQVPVTSQTKSLVMSLTVHMMSLAIDHPHHIPCSVVRSIITLEHASLNESLRANVKFLISQFSHVCELSIHLLDVGVFGILNYLLKGATSPQTFALSSASPSPSTASNRTTSVADVALFVSSVLTNISMHPSLLHKLVSSTDVNITNVILELLDLALLDSCKNVSLFLYNICMNAELFKHAPINPTFVINTLFKLNKLFPDETDLIKLNKYVVGTVLNSYDLGADVSPLYVQTIFNELHSSGSGSTGSHDSSVPSLCQGLSLISIGSANFPQSPQVLLSAKKSEMAVITLLPESENKWKQIVVRQTKIMERVVGHLSNVDPAVIKTLEHIESFPGAAFEKTLLPFEKIPIDAHVTSLFPTDSEYMQQILNEYNIAEGSSIVSDAVGSASFVDVAKES